MKGFVGITDNEWFAFLFTDIRYDELYSARLDRTNRTVVRGTNRPYQLVPPETEFKGTLEILLSDTLLNWHLGQSRDLQEDTKGDSWLHNDQWSTE